MEDIFHMVWGITLIIVTMPWWRTEGQPILHTGTYKQGEIDSLYPSPRAHNDDRHFSSVVLRFGFPLEASRQFWKIIYDQILPPPPPSKKKSEMKRRDPTKSEPALTSAAVTTDPKMLCLFVSFLCVPVYTCTAVMSWVWRLGTLVRVPSLCPPCAFWASHSHESCLQVLLPVAPLINPKACLLRNSQFC